MYLSGLRVYFKVEVYFRVTWSRMEEFQNRRKNQWIMPTLTNVEFIVDPTVSFHGWLIYSYLQIFKSIKCKWLPGECADWFITTWSYCLHTRYRMPRQQNSILKNENALNREPLPLIARLQNIAWKKFQSAGSTSIKKWGKSPVWISQA